MYSKKSIIPPGYHISNRFCNNCLRNGQLIYLWSLGNHYLCPLCNFSCDDSYDSFVPKLKNDIQTNIDNNVDLIGGEIFTDPHPGKPMLSLILKECRDSILCGLYYSSMVILSNYAEVLLKEIYFIHTGKRPDMTMGVAIKETKDFLTEEEEKEFTSIKDEIRNFYAHGNAVQILNGKYTNMPHRIVDKITGIPNNPKNLVKLSDIPSVSFAAYYSTHLRESSINFYNRMYKLANLVAFNHFNIPSVTDEYSCAVENGLSRDEFDAISDEENHELVKFGDGILIVSDNSIENAMKNAEEYDKMIKENDLFGSLE